MTLDFAIIEIKRESGKCLYIFDKIRAENERNRIRIAQSLVKLRGKDVVILDESFTCKFLDVVKIFEIEYNYSYSFLVIFVRQIIFPWKNQINHHFFQKQPSLIKELKKNNLISVDNLLDELDDALDCFRIYSIIEDLITIYLPDDKIWHKRIKSLKNLYSMIESLRNYNVVDKEMKDKIINEFDNGVDLFK